MLTNGFTYTGSSDKGGSCIGSVCSTPPDLSTILANSGWILVLLAFTVLRRNVSTRPALA